MPNLRAPQRLAASPGIGTISTPPLLASTPVRWAIKGSHDRADLDMATSSIGDIPRAATSVASILRAAEREALKRVRAMQFRR